MKQKLSYSFFSILFILITVSCSKEEKYKDYTGVRFDFAVDSIYNVTQTSATIKATLHTSGYRGDIEGLGLYLGKTEDIYAGENRTVSFNNTQGTVEITITNLDSNTVYYIEPYVKFRNMSTSDPQRELSFMTHGERPNSGTVSDIDGNVYHYITLGTQTWMVENLKTMHLRSGEAIPLLSNDSLWQENPYRAYCDYNYNSALGEKYGHLYSAEIAKSFIAPPGWHVPTVSDWKTLENYLIANGYNADKSTTGNVIAKSLAAKTDWGSSTIYSNGPRLEVSNDPTLNNSTGFTALPGGAKDLDWFGGLGFYTFFWTSTVNLHDLYYYYKQQYSFAIWSSSSNTTIQEAHDYDVLSIRCIRDN